MRTTSARWIQVDKFMSTNALNTAVIDLRSDTVTLPSQAMRQAMSLAPVGDDVYGEDPTTNRLQRDLAKMFGKEEGLFFPSGTQANLAAIGAHCEVGNRSVCMCVRVYVCMCVSVHVYAHAYMFL